MTYRAFWTCLDEQGVLVAVKKDLLYGQEVTACLALGPKTVPGAAPECDFSGLNGLLICLFVHKTQHQDLACHIVLDDCGHKTAHFLKIYIHHFGIL